MSADGHPFVADREVRVAPDDPDVLEAQVGDDGPWVDASIASVIEDLHELGFETIQSDSGIRADHPGRENYRPTQGYIAMPEEDPGRVERIKRAAEQADLVWGFNPIFGEGRTAFGAEGVSVSMPYANDGTSRLELHDRANDIFEERDGHSIHFYKGSDLDVFREKLSERNAIRRDLAGEEHGGIFDAADKEVLSRWRRFVGHLRAAGQEFSLDDLVADLQAVADDLGHPPTKLEYDDRGITSSMTLRRRFGSFNDALEAAGLEPRQPGGQPGERVTKQDIIDDIIAGRDALGIWPKANDYEDFGEYSVRTVINKFGSWTAAVDAAKEAAGPSVGGDPFADPDVASEAIRREMDEAARGLAGIDSFEDFLEQARDDLPGPAQDILDRAERAMKRGEFAEFVRENRETIDDLGITEGSLPERDLDDFTDDEKERRLTNPQASDFWPGSWAPHKPEFAFAPIWRNDSGVEVRLAQRREGEPFVQTSTGESFAGLGLAEMHDVVWDFMEDHPG